MSGGRICGALAFAGPLAFYTLTLMPGAAFWDIGEMQTVPYVLGIPHPTGFPFFVLAGWVFSHALPLGAPAWRLSLFCALAAAAGAWLLWAFVHDLTGSALPGLGAAFVFSLGDIVWTHAVRADVHDLALALGALALTAAYRAGLRRDTRALAIAALASGLGLATHPVLLFAIPGVVILAWPALARADALARARAIVLGLVPLALYAYIPLRSLAVERGGLDPDTDLGLHGNAIFNDGAPSTAHRFWAYVSGAAFDPANSAGKTFTFDGLARVATFWSGIAAKEFGVLAGAFVLGGAIVLARGRLRAALGLGACVFANLFFAPNYSVETDAERYALLVLWIACACAAYGAFALAQLVLRERSAFAGGVAAAMLLATLLATTPGAYADMAAARAFDDAGDIGPQIARHSEDGSLIIATWNFATPLIYERYVADELGTRRIVCGWPPDFAADMPAWHKRFAHIYYVVAAQYDVSKIGRTHFAKGRWQIALPR